MPFSSGKLSSLFNNFSLFSGIPIVQPLDLCSLFSNVFVYFLYCYLLALLSRHYLNLFCLTLKLFSNPLTF